MSNAAVPSNLKPILDELNEEQLAAVTHKQGPQLVVAGAGTGKTAVITRRIAYLVSAKLCAPKNILALTFTDKAAEEMESRVDLLVPYGFTDSTICTFHAFGDKVLREAGFLLGLTPAYRVLSTSEQLIFLREHLFKLPLQRLRPLSNPTKHLQIILSIISRAKDEDVTPEVYLDYCRQWEDRLAPEAEAAEQLALEKQLELANIYAAYQRLMLEQGFVDFGDLITLTLQLLRQHPDVLADLRQQYRYILVDEFQDTNAAQFELIRLLAGDEANITVVGDDDQSIYKFRGAAISNILQFRQFYPNCTLRVLVHNYRSTQPVLDTAYTLIRHNDPHRLEVMHHLNKRLRAAKPGGIPVVQMRFDTVSSESDWVADQLFKHKTEHQLTWSDMAILVRAKKQAEPFLRALNIKNIPFRFSGNQGLYKRPEVKCCTAFLRLLADPGNPLAFHELASSVVYDLPGEDLALIAATSNKTNCSMLEVLQRSLAAQEKALSEPGQSIGQCLVADIHHYLELAKRLSAGQVLYRFLTESGLLLKYNEHQSQHADLIIKNIAKFFEVVRRFEQLAPSDKVLYFVQHMDLLEEIGDDPTVSEMDPEVDAVHVLTVHRAKGLEFPVVFMVGLAANKFPAVGRTSSLGFPSELAKEDMPLEDQVLAEERRLFYVAMTRAKERLIMTSAKDYGGKRSYKRSRFVMEALENLQNEEQFMTASPLERLQGYAPLAVNEPQELKPMSSQDQLTLSYYQMDDYQACPLKYKYGHLLKIPVLPHHSVFYGNALHLAISEYFRRQLQRQSMTVEEIEAVFLKAWVNQGFISREHEESRQQAGLAALRRFVDKEHRMPSTPTFIEKSFSFQLGANKIVGRMDRVDQLRDGQVVIVDFKSSEVLDQSEADKKAADSRQLDLYSLAWRAMTGITPASLQLHFIESGLVGCTEPKPAKMDKIMTMIETVSKGIRARQFKATPSAWTCYYCSYRSICPEAERSSI